MSERIIYLNGDYLAESEAKLPVLDRGLLFADAVYEGFGILDGQIVDFIYHMQRLERSLAELTVWDAYLTSPHQQSHAQLCRFPPFVVISHAWRGTAHPDPEDRLLPALAPAIEWYMSE